MPMRLAGDEGTTSRVRATLVEGLSTAIDDVAAAAPATHRFLRYQWFASAVAVYGGPATTLVVEEDGRPVLAMPLVPVGPRMARIAAVPGSYWPFRAPVTAEGATGAVARAALALLARHRRAIRIGPVPDSDSGVTMLVEAADMRGAQVDCGFLMDRCAGSLHFPGNAVERIMRACGACGMLCSTRQRSGDLTAVEQV